MFVKIAQCEEARRNVEGVTASEKGKKLNSEMKVLQTYQDISKQMTAPQKQCGDNTLMKQALLYKTSSAEGVVAIIAGVAKEMQEDISKMEGLIIDISGICAKLPDSMDQLIDFPGREDLMGALKRFQGGTGRGFKLFDRALPALRCADILTIDGLPPMADLRKKAIEIRQMGCLQIVARSAAVICKSDCSEHVQAMLQEAKQCSVTLPKKLKALLDKLDG